MFLAVSIYIVDWMASDENGKTEEKDVETLSCFFRFLVYAPEKGLTKFWTNKVSLTTDRHQSQSIICVFFTPSSSNHLVLNTHQKSAMEKSHHTKEKEQT
jgi:hypothetical protein